MPSDRSITRILQGSAYTPEAVEEILPLVYDELRRMAAHFLKSERGDHTVMPTELVHEAYMRLFGMERISYTGRRHFFATAALAMRRILIEHERRRRAGTRIPAAALSPIESERDLPGVGGNLDIIALDQALDALARLSDRQARIVELRFFGGLSEIQIADVLEVSRPTVAREFRTARLWLSRELRA